MPEVARDGVNCVSCSSPGDKKCTACHSVTYCSAKCQKKDWSRHKRLCVPLMVQKTEHKGNGLVASKTFRIGDLILKEKACMSRGKDPGQETHSQLNKMTAEERSDFYNLTRCPDADVNGASSEVTAIFNNNAMFSGADNETGSLFLSYALINHSCSPNVFMDLTFGKETTGELRALRDKSTIVPVN